ncbi:MAG: hypothetical protein ACOY33_04695 [Pseudomonadota bacterium]
MCRRSVCRLPWLSVVLLWLAAAPLQAAYDPHKVLSLLPTDVPALVGRDIAGVRIATMRHGELVPVPFQIDEYNQRGLVWFPDAGLPLDGRQNVFDGRDRLLLLAGDASPEPLPAGSVPPSGYIGELSIQLQGEMRYLQLIAGDFPRAEQSYVRHDIASGVTETPFYTLRVDPKNELNWRHLMVRSWRGDAEQSLVDTLKMRIAGGVFTPVTRLSLDNDNLRPKVIGVRSGPIRSTLQLETLVVVSGITVMRMQAQVIRYPRYFEAYTLARIPKIYRMALVDPEVKVTVDGNNLRGGVTRTARGDGLRAVVDGKVDDAERQLIGRGLSTDDGWILFDSRNGFSMLTFLEIPAELRGIPLKLIYEDDATKRDRPERIAGQLPNLGYGIRGFPPGEDFQFGVTLAFDRDLDGVDPWQYVARWRERPLYRFRSNGH